MTTLVPTGTSVRGATLVGHAPPVPPAHVSVRDVAFSNSLEAESSLCHDVLSRLLVFTTWLLRVPVFDTGTASHPWIRTGWSVPLPDRQATCTHHWCTPRCVAHPGADRRIGAELIASTLCNDPGAFPSPDTTARHCGHAVAASSSDHPGAEDGNPDVVMLIICISVS